MKRKITFGALAGIMMLSTSSLSAQEFLYEDYETVGVYTTSEWIEVDGVADEAVWSSPSVVENTIGKTLSNWGVDPVPNTWGFSATYKAVRDANYLYLFVKVKDNAYVPYDKDKIKGETMIDNIELFFYPKPEERDPTGATVYDSRSKGLSQLRMSVGNTSNRATGGGYAMGFAVNNVITGYEYATVQTADGYNVEAVIPWDIVISEANIGNLAVGKKILFDINVANCTDYASDRVIILGWSGNDFQSWKANSRLGEMEFKGEFSGISESEQSDANYQFNNGILQLFNVEDGAKVVINDLGGRAVGSQTYDGQDINLTSLTSGIYLVQVEGAKPFKIIK